MSLLYVQHSNYFSKHITPQEYNTFRNAALAKQNSWGECSVGGFVYGMKARERRGGDQVIEVEINGGHTGTNVQSDK